MTDKEEILQAISVLRSDVAKLDQDFAKLDRDVERFSDRLETYQRANDRLIGLVTTIVTGASAIIILAPLGRVAADFSAKALGL